MGKEAITCKEADWATAEPHTWGFTSIPKLWARTLICLEPVIPPHEPISGWAMSMQLFSNKFLNPYNVCSFSPPAIGVVSLDFNSV